MPKPYYTLAVLIDGRWSPEFGDYDRDVVDDEMRDTYLDGGWKRNQCRIVRTADDQAAITAAIAKLNT